MMHRVSTAQEVEGSSEKEATQAQPVIREIPKAILLSLLSKSPRLQRRCIIKGSAEGKVTVCHFSGVKFTLCYPLLYAFGSAM